MPSFLYMLLSLSIICLGTNPSDPDTQCCGVMSWHEYAQFISPFSCQWTSSLFPVLHYYKQYCPVFVYASKRIHRSSQSCIPKNGIAGSWWTGIVTFIFALCSNCFTYWSFLQLRCFLVWKIHEVGNCLICHPPQSWTWRPVHNWGSADTSRVNNTIGLNWKLFKRRGWILSFSWFFLSLGSGFDTK